MKRNYLKQNIVRAVLVSVMLTGMLGTGIGYAQEENAPQMVEATAGKLTDEQKQAIAEIVKKLEEVESELLQLSLVVTKLALEEQVVALQQQIAVAQAMGGEVKDTGITMGEPVAEEPESTELTEELLQEDSALVQDAREEEESKEDIFARVDVQKEDENKDEDGDEEDRGFLAALGPLGNLGTPELAVLVILAILAVFILVRRLRGRKQDHSPAPNIPMRVQEQSPPQQGTF